MASARLALLAVSSAIVLWVLYGALVAGCRRLVRRVLTAEQRRLATIVPRTAQIESRLAHIAGLLQWMRAEARGGGRRRGHRAAGWPRQRE